MPIDYDKALHHMNAAAERVPFSYTDRDVMLYALGIGLGADPMNEAELPFVYEKNLQVVPTAATVLPSGVRFPTARSQFDLNIALVLHGEERLQVHRPLAPQDSLTIESKLKSIFDKGKEKGAVLSYDLVLRDPAGAPVVTLTRTLFARGDGGFGGPSEGQPQPHEVPNRSPDLVVALPTRPDQALLYRLCGDRNPLHCDPEAARAAGFQMPILHGLCSYGVTCRAILQSVAGYDASRILSHAVRFSSPVFPGETIVTDIWVDGEDVSFEAGVAERPGVKVIRNGHAKVREAS